jgi:hypothetical protein
MINETYRPENYGKEYVKIKGHSDLFVQFISTSLGLKRSYDDWFDASKLGEIDSLAKQYGLKYKIDWVFEPEKDVSKVVDGGAKLPTTRMRGVPYSDKIEHGQAHIFFSKEKKFLEGSYRNGWYPLIIGNRAVHKPYIDVLRFGYFLGYPDCCIDFFRRYNNWGKFNYLYEIKKNTKMKESYLCNPLLKNHTYSYIYHMPCSFDCKRTMDYSRQLREKLLDLEPKLVNKIDGLLKNKFLVFDELFSVLLKGEIEGDILRYNYAEGAGHPGINESDSSRKEILSLLKLGDSLKIEDDKITIYKKDGFVGAFKKQKEEGFILDFEDGCD